MSETLYNTKILRLAASIPHEERLARPQATVRKVSSICGSRVTVDIALADGKVADFGQEVRACALGQASASILGAHVIGKTHEELKAAQAALETTLTQEDAPEPPAPWQDLQIFAPARPHKSRHGSVLLAFQAVNAAVAEALAPEEAG